MTESFLARNCFFLQMIGLSAKDIPQINLLTLYIILSLLSKQINQLGQKIAKQINKHATRRRLARERKRRFSSSSEYGSLKK